MRVVVYGRCQDVRYRRALDNFTAKGLVSAGTTRRFHEAGFYYCDTLLEPHCTAEKLRVFRHPDATIGKDVDWQALLEICHGAFSYDRFHRDFNLDSARADARYDKWLYQLYEQKAVYGLFWRGELSGFIAHLGGKLVLHALASSYRSKGLAKYWWHEVKRSRLSRAKHKKPPPILGCLLACLILGNLPLRQTLPKLLLLQVLR